MRTIERYHPLYRAFLTANVLILFPQTNDTYLFSLHGLLTAQAYVRLTHA